jgi:aminopeptidase
MTQTTPSLDHMYQRYAHLLTNYCLEVQRDEKVMIRSTYHAEPLLVKFAEEIAIAGGIPVLQVDIQDFDNAWLAQSELSQLEWVNPMYQHWNENFKCFMYIRAPFETKDQIVVPIEKRNIHNQAQAPVRQIYMDRTGTRDMKRGLCQFPTIGSAEEAGMSLEEYQNFVFNACNLFDENPMQTWQNFGKNQQKVVDFLNARSEVRYVGSNCDLKFSTKGRIWINSDGKTNMPSGEVYTAPVDDSMNGWVRFSLPSLYMGETVENVSLEIKNGFIESWNATSNKEFLDKIFAIDGTRRFGEAAVGTNYKIQQSTRNILFDEKIGGTIHLAIGDAYKQCNGINQSTVHWDMITSMADGEIYADGELCYKNGKFIVE